MIATLAQLPEPLLTGLMQGGTLAVIVGILLWRDWRRDERDFQREQRRDEQLGKLTSAVQHLVRITSIEVLSRPSVQKRAEEEAREIHGAVSQSGGK